MTLRNQERFDSADDLKMYNRQLEELAYACGCLEEAADACERAGLSFVLMRSYCDRAHKEFDKLEARRDRLNEKHRTRFGEELQ